MSEPTYPEAWGSLYRPIEGGAWWKYLRDSRPEDQPRCEIVRLIPEPEVDQRIGDVVQKIRDALQTVIPQLDQLSRIKLVYACRDSSGPCFCGCHVSEAMRSGEPVEGGE